MGSLGQIVSLNIKWLVDKNKLGCYRNTISILISKPTIKIEKARSFLVKIQHNIQYI